MVEISSWFHWTGPPLALAAGRRQSWLKFKSCLLSLSASASAILRTTNSWLLISRNSTAHTGNVLQCNGWLLWTKAPHLFIFQNNATGILRHPELSAITTCEYPRHPQYLMTILAAILQCGWWWWVLRYCRGGARPPQDRKTIVYTSWCQQIIVSSSCHRVRIQRCLPQD